MGVGEVFEETDVKSTDASFFVLDEGWELVVVANEDESFCESDWSQAYRKGNLRCFIYDAVIEGSFVEDGVIDT